MSITVANLQDKRVVFQIFITLLRYSFDSASYISDLLDTNKQTHELFI